MSFVLLGVNLTYNFDTAWEKAKNGEIPVIKTEEGPLSDQIPVAEPVQA